MASVPSVASTLQDVLGPVADDAARATGCVRRVRKFTGASLCQTLVFGWLAHPQASLSDLCGAAADSGVPVSRQGIDQRLQGTMARRLAAMLARVLAAAIEQVVVGHQPTISLLARFPAVIVEDSSTLTLPPGLADQWAGCGGSAGASGAALKLVLRSDLVHGGVTGPLLAPGRVHDATLADAQPLPAPGSLYLTDLGYFGLTRFARLDAAGIWYLSRLRADTLIIDAAGRPWQPGAWLAAQHTDQVDAPVQLGAAARLPVRLLAQRLPPAVATERRRRLRAAAKREGRMPGADALRQCAWTILITNLRPACLSLPEALALVSARWQIELVWKLWKTDGGLRTLRSAQPDAVCCELYAKLIGLLVQHWVMLTAAVPLVGISRVRLAADVRQYAPFLAQALARHRGVQAVLRSFRQHLHPGLRLTTRRAHPSTAQRLRNPDLCLS
jgi:hypothetical protein